MVPSESVFSTGVFIIPNNATPTMNKPIMIPTPRNAYRFRTLVADLFSPWLEAGYEDVVTGY